VSPLPEELGELTPHAPNWRRVDADARERGRHAVTVAPAVVVVATRPRDNPAHLPDAWLAMRRAHTYIWVRYRLPLAMLALSPTAVAAHAAGVAHADVVPFALVSDVVRTETAYRAALESAQRAGNVSDADAARRLAESIGRVCDAIEDAADVWDAEPVVAIEPGNACHAATLQASGVSYVRPLATVAGGFVSSHNGRATAAFDSIADAVAHAAGPVAPVVLPGENADAVAAVLAIRADAAAGRRVSLADLARAQSAAIRADGDAAHARGIARAAGMRAAINAELARD